MGSNAIHYDGNGALPGLGAALPDLGDLGLDAGALPTVAGQRQRSVGVPLLDEIGLGQGDSKGRKGMINSNGGPFFFWGRDVGEKRSFTHYTQVGPSAPSIEKCPNFCFFFSYC